MQSSKDIIFVILSTITLIIVSFILGVSHQNKLQSKPVANMQDYQLQYHLDTLAVYEGTRFVGMHIDSNYQHGSFIDSLILSDNR